MAKRVVAKRVVAKRVVAKRVVAKCVVARGLADHEKFGLTYVDPNIGKPWS